MLQVGRVVSRTELLKLGVEQRSGMIKARLPVEGREPPRDPGTAGQVNTEE